MVVNGSTVCKTPLDRLNLLEVGKTSYRDCLPICSTHVTVDKSTGKVQERGIRRPTSSRQRPCRQSDMKTLLRWRPHSPARPLSSIYSSELFAESEGKLPILYRLFEPWNMGTCPITISAPCEITWNTGFFGPVFITVDFFGGSSGDTGSIGKILPLNNPWPGVACSSEIWPVSSSPG
jgi:hypothetical protein